MKIDRMMAQSGAKLSGRGTRIAYLPERTIAFPMAATIRLAVTVPSAAPKAPYRGMSTTLNAALSTVAAIPRRSGVRASPAARNAPPSMKKTSIPTLPTNIVRRKGSAAAFTSGAARTTSSRYGASTYPAMASTTERKIEVRNACWTTRLTLSASPAPVKRATSTPMPEYNDAMKTMTTRKICQLTPMAAFEV